MPTDDNNGSLIIDVKVVRLVPVGMHVFHISSIE